MLTFLATPSASMSLGLPIPSIYIVPPIRFCRTLGPTLGLNLSEFEFPCYFSFFVLKRSCRLIVEGQEAEKAIRDVFEETLLGPQCFRGAHAVRWREEDFGEGANMEGRPNLCKEVREYKRGNKASMTRETSVVSNFIAYKTLSLSPLLASLRLASASPLAAQFEHFRMMPDGKGGTKELEISDLLSFIHFTDVYSRASSTATPLASLTPTSSRSSSLTSPPSPSAPPPRSPRVSCPTPRSIATIPGAGGSRVEVYRTYGTSSYVIHDVSKAGEVVGRAVVSGNVRVDGGQRIKGFGKILKETGRIDTEPKRGGGDGGGGEAEDEKPILRRRSRSSGDLEIAGGGGSVPALLPNPAFSSPQPPAAAVLPLTRRFFTPPSFGVTVLGNSHGFDPGGSTSGYVLWLNGRGVMIDPPPFAGRTLEEEVRFWCFWRFALFVKRSFQL